MKYKLLLSDIDGTLRPNGEAVIPRGNAEAVAAVQRLGVRFAVATGRGRAGIPDALLSGIEPDYWICAAGAQVLDREGNAIASSRMDLETMEALTAFCEAGGYALLFHFSDGPYAYTGYDAIRRSALARGQIPMARNGEDRRRHLAELPFSAAAVMPREAAARFQADHSRLGLRFPYYSSGGCDILRPGQDKSLGLRMLLEHTGLSREECVSVGDGNNDVDILRLAGLSYCVAGGEPDALEAADRTAPAAETCAVAAVCREIWPEAFA